MNNFLSNVEAKGWDKFLLDVKKEFKNIREDLSIIENNNSISGLLNSAKSSNSNAYNDLSLKTEADIKKEFMTLREALKIESFII